VVNLDPALGEEFLDVAVGQGEAQVPADREDDDIRWEAEAGIGGPCAGAGEGGGFSYRQSRCQDAVAADATVPCQACLAGLPAVLGPERVANLADQARVRFHAAA